MSTGFPSGMRKHRITVKNRVAATVGPYGVDSTGAGWDEGIQFWAAVDWSRGTRAMNEGALDAYAVIIVRMLWNDVVNMRSRVVYEGLTYQILPETFHSDKMADTIQFSAQVIINE